MDNLPLSRIRVIELGDNVAAPFCGQILGDLGADVIKVERPGPGDPARHWEPAAWNGLSPSFAALNRNKRSVIVDLKDRQSLRQLKVLIGESDVFVHNLRPGTEGDFGLDGKTLLESNPRLVYCAVGAFGREGPLSRKPGYDPLMQAFGGIMSVTGNADGPPVRVGVPMIDCSAGLWGALGIMSALNGRHASGRGAVVDTSLYEASLAFMALVSAQNIATGSKPGRFGSGAMLTAPFRAYATADGDLVVACANDRLFGKLAEVLGHPEWVDDEQLATNVARVRNRDLVDRLIGDILSKAPRAMWQDRFDGAGIPNAPLQDIEEVHRHPQTVALGMLLSTSRPGMSLMGLPMSFDGERPGIRRDPPQHGEHTSEIFGSQGGVAGADAGEGGG